MINHNDAALPESQISANSMSSLTHYPNKYILERSSPQHKQLKRHTDLCTKTHTWGASTDGRCAHRYPSRARTQAASVPFAHQYTRQVAHEHARTPHAEAIGCWQYLSVASLPTGTHFGPGSRRPQAHSHSSTFTMWSVLASCALSDMRMVLLMSKCRISRAFTAIFSS